MEGRESVQARWRHAHGPAGTKRGRCATKPPGRGAWGTFPATPLPLTPFRKTVPQARGPPARAGAGAHDRRRRERLAPRGDVQPKLAECQQSDVLGQGAIGVLQPHARSWVHLALQAGGIVVVHLGVGCAIGAGCGMGSWRHKASIGGRGAAQEARVVSAIHVRPARPTDPAGAPGPRGGRRGGLVLLRFVSPRTGRAPGRPSGAGPRRDSTSAPVPSEPR